MTYTIKTPYAEISFNRRDHAAHAIRTLTYAAIEANGGLDTAWGHKLYNELDRLASDISTGSYSLIDFSTKLPHGAGYIQVSRV